MTVPLTSKGWDDENDLKSNYHLLSTYKGSSTMRGTLHVLYWILTYLQGMSFLSLAVISILSAREGQNKA